jgi:hypothetical protein
MDRGAFRRRSPGWRGKCGTREDLSRRRASADGRPGGAFGLLIARRTMSATHGVTSRLKSLAQPYQIVCIPWRHMRRGMYFVSIAAASIMDPPAMNTDGNPKTVNSNAQTVGGPSCETSRKLTNTVVISARSCARTARRNSRFPAPSMVSVPSAASANRNAPRAGRMRESHRCSERRQRHIPCATGVAGRSDDRPNPRTARARSSRIRSIRQFRRSRRPTPT